MVIIWVFSIACSLPFGALHIADPYRNVEPWDKINASDLPIDDGGESLCFVYYSTPDYSNLALHARAHGQVRMASVQRVLDNHSVLYTVDRG